MAKEPRQNTYARIIETSQMLFNEEGERNISTNHIAAHLGISPGNLYYHFRNKDEIIMQLYKQYSEEQVLFLKEEQVPRTVEELVIYFGRIYDLLWRYRFLFSDVNSLLARNNDLVGEHETTKSKLESMIVSRLSQLADNGVIQGTIEEITSLTLNVWIISKYWFNFDQSMQGSNKLTEESKIRGVVRSLSLFKPYLTLERAAEFDRVMVELAEPEN